MKIKAILISTFKEITRQKIFLVLLGISFFIVLSSLIIFPISAGEGERILKDFGISIIPLINVFFIVVIGSISFYEEFEKRTIYILKSSPIRGWEIAGGKFGAFFIIVFIITHILFIIHQFTLFITTRKLDLYLYISLVPFFFEFIILISIIIFFSSFSNYLLSAFLTLCIYISGHSMSILKFLSQQIKSLLLKNIISAIYFAFPNLEYFDVKTKILSHENVHPEYFIFSICYSIAYTLFFLFLSHIILEKREYR